MIRASEADEASFSADGGTRMTGRYLQSPLADPRQKIASKISVLGRLPFSHENHQIAQS